MKSTKNSNFQLMVGSFELTLDQLLVYLIFLLCCIYSFLEPADFFNSIVGTSH